jgi:hypothetical protein
MIAPSALMVSGNSPRLRPLPGFFAREFLQEGVGGDVFNFQGYVDGRSLPRGIVI